MSDRSFVDRVASEAADVRPLKVLLTVIAFPFYLLGLLVGVVWVAAVFAIGACKVGVADVRARAQHRATVVP